MANQALSQNQADGSEVKKILVVDDAPFMRMRSCRLLKENGFECVEAGNGLEALQKYQTEKPDAVLMDITMPEMDGLQALEEMKKIDPEARVCILTAMGQQSVVMEAIKSGARDFVVKPFDPDRVLGAVLRMLG